MSAPQRDAGPADDPGERIETALAALLGEHREPAERLVEAMHYSLLAPGKRVRARMTLLAGADLGASEEDALVPGCAVELVHTASLIIDDLPAMDDAALRRGVAANHRVYGEATGILAAIGLLNEAFATLAGRGALAPALRVELLARLARCVGADGLIGGQERDLNQGVDAVDVDDIEDIQRRKTGVLFAFATWAGARVAGRSAPECAAMHEFGTLIGVAFQTYDDLADRLSPVVQVGKDTRRDAGKPTLVAHLGVSGAVQRADRHFAAALERLRQVPGRADRLLRYVQALHATLRQRIDDGSGAARP